MDYVGIFQGLNQGGVDYLLVGGLAVNLHGLPRMTYDLDIMILLDESNVAALASLLSSWGYRPRVPVDPLDLADPAKREAWERDKNMKALCFVNEREPVAEIDVVLSAPASYADMRERAVRVPFAAGTVPVASIPDLIAMKRATGRPQDADDARHLALLAERA